MVENLQGRGHSFSPTSSKLPLPKTSSTPGDENTFEAHTQWLREMLMICRKSEGLDLKRHRSVKANVFWRPGVLVWILLLQQLVCCCHMKVGEEESRSQMNQTAKGQVGDDPSRFINQKVIECIHNNVVPSNYCATTCIIILLLLTARDCISQIEHLVCT